MAVKKLEDNPSPYETKVKGDYLADWDIHRYYIQTFDAYEAMMLGQVYDTVSASIDGSKITDSYSTTLAIERAARVMGKLPDGQTVSVAKADQGKAMFMDILRQKWIYPNANAQHPFETKLRLWQLYSSVYGYMPMFYDWNISPTGYTGPDCWLWNPRNLVPQQGRTSIGDMDYVTALTWVSKKFLQDKLENPQKEDGWNRDALTELIEMANNEKSSRDPYKDTLTMLYRTPQLTKRGVLLATRYEAGQDGEWVTFAPDHAYIEVRRLQNPHKNGRIPFVIKYSQPLFDSFYGMGDFQRAKPLQFARDGLDNFYFKGIKMNLVPPIVANANGVLKHTLDYREGAVMFETVPNSIRRLETSTAGLATYQAAKQALTGSLLALYGSQNASIPGADALNPSQGKTPAAIGLYSDKEADRDGQEREYLEEAIEQLTDGFNSLVVNIGTEEVPVALFADDIEDIVEAGYQDIMQIFQSGGKFAPNSTLTGGVLKIDPAKLKGVEYRFNIDTGSTAKINKAQQLQTWQNIADTIAKFQNIFKDDPRVDVNWAKIMEVGESLTDLQGAKDFITVNPNAPTPQQAEMDAQKAKESIQINYADAPPDIQRQMEAAAGFTPAQTPSPSETQQAKLHHDMLTAADPAAQQAQELQLKAAESNLTLQTKAEEHKMQMAQDIQRHNLEMAKTVDNHSMGMAQSQQKHEVGMAQAKAKAQVAPKKKE